MNNNTSNNHVQIAGTDVTRVEYKGHQVVTYAMIDKVHQRPDGTAKDAFARNRNRFVEGEDFHNVSRKVWPTEIDWPFEKQAPSGRLITKRGYLKIAKTLGDDKAWEVFDEMIERYFAVEVAPLKIPQTYGDALRFAAEQYEARQIAERTKAEIGHRREATAMNTASQAVKKANKLQKALDRSMEFATVKRMEMSYKKDFAWRPLKKAAEMMGIPSLEVPDTNYGKVKAYHADVWQEVYGVEIPAVEVA
ncbi:ORF6N domain-containing protein [Brucella pituitosa]|uniref:ORF6N domain-containing protein n=1 Tax=Brucella pituitosa TaxID=571256 RepID=UPI0009A13F5D|nr:ORF6N domain-containing protein [Brucella pituitosa]